MEHTCRKYTHTHTLTPLQGWSLGRPWDRSAPWRTGGCFCYYFLPVLPRRHPDISPELEQREGDLKKESEKNKRKRKKEKGGRETGGRGRGSAEAGTLEPQ